jgi:negative modulator of initiation of replication
MSKLIEIDDQLYEYLRGNIKEFGETASDVLRRLLKPNGHPVAPPDATTKGRAGSNLVPGPNSQTVQNSLTEFVLGPDMRLKRNPTDRYLAIIGFACGQKHTIADKLLQLGGRGRKYFGDTESDVASSGTSTHPRQIPGTKYWALTNASTYHKGEILEMALRALGYSEAEILAARSTLA